MTKTPRELPARARRTWPFLADGYADRPKRLAVEYRAALRAERARADALQEVLSKVDLRALRKQDSQLADRVEKLVGEVHPDRLAELDRKFAEWGVEWHLDPGQEMHFEYDDDDLVPGKFAAPDILGTGKNLLNKLRIHGVIKGVDLGGKDGFLFRIGDVRKIPEVMGGRGWRAIRPEDRIRIRSDT